MPIGSAPRGQRILETGIPLCAIPKAYAKRESTAGDTLPATGQPSACRSPCLSRRSHRRSSRLVVTGAARQRPLQRLHQQQRTAVAVGLIVAEPINPAGRRQRVQAVCAAERTLVASASMRTGAASSGLDTLGLGEPTMYMVDELTSWKPWLR